MEHPMSTESHPSQSISADEVPPNVIGEILVSSRSLAEYRAMFALSDGDLHRRILDCPGGTASFTAEVCAAGGDATACDPVYAQYTTDELAAMSQRETDRGNRYCRTHPDQYVWTFFSDPDDHAASRSSAGRRFADDHPVHPERYVPGALPYLPFDDREFDLVLSSHLLFSYADRLDLTFHHHAARELMRVTREEVRIFPLVAMGAINYSHLDALRRLLAVDGIDTAVVSVNYEFQRGGNRMLVCTRTTDN
jgi:SAM-dependent methyltransferase